jgi:hypothetical protein
MQRVSLDSKIGGLDKRQANLTVLHIFVPPLQVLLLGCGDVRNALTTAAALRSAASSSSSSSSCEVHLNDISDAILARDALLLAAATTMDPGSAEDVEFLWALWFCAQLSAEHRQRLDLLLQQVRVVFSLFSESNV